MKYLTLKAAILAAKEKYGIHELDLPTRELLHAIGHADFSGERVCISDLKNQGFHGTLPTVLTRLDMLVDGGWVQRREDKSDKRVFLLKPTAKARKAFQKISAMLGVD